MTYTTRKELLQAVHDNQDDAWKNFESFYKPLIMLRAKDFKLQPHEADELRQNVLVAVFRGDATGKYDPSKGRFRDYLRRIITNCAIDILRNRLSHEHLQLSDQIPQENDDEAFDREWKECLLDQAKTEVRENCEPSTYMAYLLYGEQGMPVKEVARILKMNEMQVYQAKTRTLKRIQAAVQRLSQELGE